MTTRVLQASSSCQLIGLPYSSLSKVFPSAVFPFYSDVDVFDLWSIIDSNIHPNLTPESLPTSQAIKSCINKYLHDFSVEYVTSPTHLSELLDSSPLAYFGESRSTQFTHGSALTSISEVDQISFPLRIICST